MNEKKRRQRTHFTEEQKAAVRARYPYERAGFIAADIHLTPTQVCNLAHYMGISKSAGYVLGFGNDKSGWVGFKKDHVPHNKGKKGISYPGSEATQFKKGNKSLNWKPIGTERFSKEGYVQVKISCTGYSPRDYVPIHILVWELHHGAVPPKHHVAFKDGNKQNIVIENLELVSFVEMMKRNSYHNNYPKEIAKVIQLRGAINRQINKRKK